MNIGGYKGVTPKHEDFTNWEAVTQEPAFYDIRSLNPAYKTIVYNVEQCDQFDSIRNALIQHPHLGMSLKWNKELESAGKKKINLVAALCLATPQKVYIFRSHMDTRLPGWLVSLLDDKKQAKCVIGSELTLQKVNQRMQKTFEKTPKGLEECRKWAAENLKPKRGDPCVEQIADEDDEFLWFADEYNLPHVRCTSDNLDRCRKIEEEFDWEDGEMTIEQQRKCADDAYYALQIFLCMKLRKERGNPRRDKTLDDEHDRRQRQGKGKGICVRAETNDQVLGLSGMKGGGGAPLMIKGGPMQLQPSMSMPAALKGGSCSSSTGGPMGGGTTGPSNAGAPGMGMIGKGPLPLMNHPSAHGGPPGGSSSSGGGAAPGMIGGPIGVLPSPGGGGSSSSNSSALVGPPGMPGPPGMMGPGGPAGGSNPAPGYSPAGQFHYPGPSHPLGPGEHHLPHQGGPMGGLGGGGGPGGSPPGSGQFLPGSGPHPSMGGPLGAPPAGGAAPPGGPSMHHPHPASAPPMVAGFGSGGPLISSNGSSSISAAGMAMLSSSLAPTYSQSSTGGGGRAAAPGYGNPLCATGGFYAPPHQAVEYSNSASTPHEQHADQHQAQLLQHQPASSGSTASSTAAHLLPPPHRANSAPHPGASCPSDSAAGGGSGATTGQTTASGSNVTTTSICSTNGGPPPGGAAIKMPSTTASSNSNPINVLAGKKGGPGAALSSTTGFGGPPPATELHRGSFRSRTSNSSASTPPSNPSNSKGGLDTAGGGRASLMAPPGPTGGPTSSSSNGGFSNPAPGCGVPGAVDYGGNKGGMGNMNMMYGGGPQHPPGGAPPHQQHNQHPHQGVGGGPLPHPNYHGAPGPGAPAPGYSYGGPPAQSHPVPGGPDYANTTGGPPYCGYSPGAAPLAHDVSMTVPDDLYSLRDTVKAIKLQIQAALKDSAPTAVGAIALSTKVGLSNQDNDQDILELLDALNRNSVGMMQFSAKVPREISEAKNLLKEKPKLRFTMFTFENVLKRATFGNSAAKQEKYLSELTGLLRSEHGDDGMLFVFHDDSSYEADFYNLQNRDPHNNGAPNLPPHGVYLKRHQNIHRHEVWYVDRSAGGGAATGGGGGEKFAMVELYKYGDPGPRKNTNTRRISGGAGINNVGEAGAPGAPSGNGMYNDPTYHVAHAGGGGLGADLSGGKGYDYGKHGAPVGKGPPGGKMPPPVLVDQFGRGPPGIEPDMKGGPPPSSSQQGAAINMNMMKGGGGPPPAQLQPSPMGGGSCCGPPPGVLGGSATSNPPPYGGFPPSTPAADPQFLPHPPHQPAGDPHLFYNHNHSTSSGPPPPAATTPGGTGPPPMHHYGGGMPPVLAPGKGGPLGGPQHIAAPPPMGGGGGPPPPSGFYSGAPHPPPGAGPTHPPQMGGGPPPGPASYGASGAGGAGKPVLGGGPPPPTRGATPGDNMYAGPPCMMGGPPPGMGFGAAPGGQQQHSSLPPTSCSPVPGLAAGAPYGNIGSSASCAAAKGSPGSAGGGVPVPGPPLSQSLPPGSNYDGSTPGGASMIGGGAAPGASGPPAHPSYGLTPPPIYGKPGPGAPPGGGAPWGGPGGDQQGAVLLATSNGPPPFPPTLSGGPAPGVAPVSLSAPSASGNPKDGMKGPGGRTGGGGVPGNKGGAPPGLGGPDSGDRKAQQAPKGGVVSAANGLEASKQGNTASLKGKKK